MASSSWIRRLFPSLGSFIFWLIWPWIMMRLTQLAAQMVGKRLSKDDTTNLKRDFTRITRSIAKAAAPEEKAADEAEIRTDRKIFARKVLIGAAIVAGVSAISVTAAVVTTKAMQKK